MASIYPIEFPIEEARKQVAPDSLEAVLKVLKEVGVISYYVVRTEVLLVWPADRENDEAQIPLVRSTGSSSGQ